MISSSWGLDQVKTFAIAKFVAFNNAKKFIHIFFRLGGCVLANRLTENPKWNVLLIEAGDVETPLHDVPMLAPYSVFSKFNWGYNAEPQPEACLGNLINFLNIYKSSSRLNEI